MPRKRNPENAGLPKRWKFQHGAYYYQVPRGLEEKWNGKKLFPLGKNLSDAYREWASRLETIEAAKTVNDLLDRYTLEVIPRKAISTQYLNKLYLTPLRKVFGHMGIDEIKPMHIYSYVDARKVKKTVGKRTKGGLSIAKREIGMFSDAYTKAVQWGYIHTHPFKNEIKLEGEKGRSRYIENWELDCFLSLGEKRKGDPTKFIQAYANIKVLTGLRQQDMLCLKTNDLKETGIEVNVKKTGAEITIEWTPALRQAVDLALSIRPVDISPYVFCTRRGKSYYNDRAADPSSGFKTIFKRYMRRVLDETDLEAPFTEHDLRAKTASDLEDIEHARKLLAHSSQNTTKRYIRKRQKVAPLR